MNSQVNNEYKVVADSLCVGMKQMLLALMCQANYSQTDIEEMNILLDTDIGRSAIRILVNDICSITVIGNDSYYKKLIEKLMETIVSPT